MREYQTEYAKLNPSQQLAVNTTDGPVLVVAGPGTGKTQLLSLRVANILQQPGVTPDQILCLTFTDSAARNMQERLTNLVGRPAYHVSVQTFHSFGDRIINQYPDNFTERALMHPLDELGQYSLLRQVFDSLSHDSPLSTKVGEDYIYLKDVRQAIGWCKQAGLSPLDLEAILAGNDLVYKKAKSLVGDCFQTQTSGKHLELYAELAKNLANIKQNKLPGGFKNYTELAVRELIDAIEVTKPGARYAPEITAWRNRWLEKDSEGRFDFKDSIQNPKLHEMSQIYIKLHDLMTAQGLYDFDDMLLEVVQALEHQPELSLNLAERYQYILVDEFQDTNQAQLRLLWALGDTDPNEGRPNIMVVGDPNQAIYSFQGAFTSSFAQFQERYRDVVVVNLTDNYRSTQNILDASLEVIRQQPDAISLFSTDKLQLIAHASHSQDIIEHDVLGSELAHYQWLADKINEYIAQGVSPDQIAVIAPRHRYLERLVPYLAENQIPVAYERRENVLDAPLIIELIKACELIQAIHDNDQSAIDALMGEVLGFEFWGIPTEDLIKLSITCYDMHAHWLPTALASEDQTIKNVAKFFVRLAQVAATEPLEYILDQLGGGKPEQKSQEEFVSPFNAFYFSNHQLDNHTEIYLNHLAQLTAIRQRLRNWHPDRTLLVTDLLEFIKLHRQANINILSTNPHVEASNAVQLMTGHKAKGLEFDIVFVANAVDEVWGSAARQYVDKVRLPKNIPIKPAGDHEHDKIKLFFVALTRAKHSLHVVSYTHNLDDKLSLGVSFIGGNSSDSEVIHPHFQPKVIARQTGPEAVRILSTAWAYRFRTVIADKPTLFEPILSKYSLSATHLNNFLDVVEKGPEYFVRHNLLRFPEAMSPSAAYGDAIHQTLRMVANSVIASKHMPSSKVINKFYDDILTSKHLRASDYKRFKERGIKTLDVYLTARSEQFGKNFLSERGFSKEGVVLGNARLSGKIDVINFTSPSEIEVIDYKTGKASSSWQGREEFERAKLHRYKIQLYFYKILIERSASYGRKVNVLRGGLDFVEPADKTGILHDQLWTDYNEDEQMRTEALIQAVWKSITSLELPDITSFSRDSQGIIDFENYLINNFRPTN